MEFTVDQIAQLLDGTVEGDGSQMINNLEKIQEGKPGSIGFLANLKYEKHLYSTHCSAIIVSKDFVPQKSYTTTLVKVTDPYSAFSKLLESYAELTKPNPLGVEEPSFFGNDSTIG
ncbi:LpxD N-terminal domain-containing protein, partial [Winogradskyella psychrotolerans]